MLVLRTSFCIAFLLTSVVAQQPAPAVLRAQVPNRGLAQGVPFALGDTACMCTQKGTTPKTMRPSLVWSRTGRLPVKNEPAAALQWLRQHSAALGHGAFTPVFAEARNFHEYPMLVFTLEHAGTRLHDAEIWILSLIHI